MSGLQPHASILIKNCQDKMFRPFVPPQLLLNHRDVSGEFMSQSRGILDFATWEETSEANTQGSIVVVICTHFTTGEPTESARKIVATALSSTVLNLALLASRVLELRIGSAPTIAETPQARSLCTPFQWKQTVHSFRPRFSRYGPCITLRRRPCCRKLWSSAIGS
jgi:hypothetical protein